VYVVTRAARRELGAGPGLLIGTGYALAWGIQAAVAYDFHEVAFAVPILALVTDRLMCGRYRAAAAWAATLVLVKEDLPATVVVVGALTFWSGRRRLGVALAAFGAGSLVLIVGVVLPALSFDGEYAYWSKAGVADGGGAGVPAKLWGLALLLIPVAFTALRSPLLLIVAPTVGWHLLSDNPAYSGTRFHYAVMLMPVVFLAAVDGLVKLRGRRWSRHVPAVVAALGLVFVLTGPFGNMLRPSWWTPAPYARAGAAAVAVIPDGARVVALNRFAAQLTATHTVFLLDAGLRDQVGRRIDAEWVVAETATGRWPITAAQRRELLDVLRVCGYIDVYRGDNVVTLRRTAGAPRGPAFDTCLRDNGVA
jgi:uncharacterized membrane protein